MRLNSAILWAGMLALSGCKHASTIDCHPEPFTNETWYSGKMVFYRTIFVGAGQMLSCTPGSAIYSHARPVVEIESGGGWVEGCSFYVLSNDPEPYIAPTKEAK